jgi:hypothetical protein
VVVGVVVVMWSWRGEGRLSSSGSGVISNALRMRVVGTLRDSFSHFFFFSFGDVQWRGGPSDALVVREWFWRGESHPE